MNTTKKLKIGILLRNRHDGPGGLEKVLEVLSSGIQKKPVELYFYGLLQPKYKDFTKKFQKITYLTLPKSIKKISSKLPASISRIIEKIYVKQSGYQLFDTMIKDDIDVLIIMDLSSQFLKNYKFLCYLKKHSKIKLLSWIHISLTGSKNKVAQQVKQKMKVFDGHLAISKGLAVELQNDYNAQNISLIYNPIDSAKIIPRDKTKFIYIGRITKIKRVDSLLNQLSQLNGNWSLDIYGSTGNENSDIEFKNLITHLNLTKKVSFHGWQKDAWSKIDNAGILLLNSTREGFGLVIVEAMQRGIPVLASDCPVGPAELIHHGTNGWLYPIDAEYQIKDILQSILDGSTELPDPLLIQNSVQQYETQSYLNNFIEKINSYVIENK